MMQTTAEPPQNLSLSTTKRRRSFPHDVHTTSVNATSTVWAKKSETVLIIQRICPHDSSKIFFGHLLSTTPYNASDVRADQYTVGVPEKQPDSIDLSEFRGSNPRPWDNKMNIQPLGYERSRTVRLVSYALFIHIHTF